MLNPIRLTNDLFDDRELKDDDLQAFSEDHLIRFSNNNPGGIYSTIISDTSNKHIAYYGALVSEATKIAVREGLTQTMMGMRKLMLDEIVSVGKLTDYLFSGNQEVYQQFFPQGVTEYHNADLPELNPIIDRLVAAAGTHLTADYPDDVTALTDAVNNFKNARAAQLNAFSQEEALASDRRTARKNLTRQLTSNFLTLAKDFLELPDIFNNYYNPELLPLTTEDDDVIDITLNPGEEKIVTEEAPDDDTEIKMEHLEGDGIAQFCTAPDATSACTGDTYNLNPQTTFEGEYGSLGISGNPVVKIKNLGTDTIVVRLRRMSQ